ncbi:hypothetical protein H0H81_001677 [Sphagnurus paluster]|uniref:Uncharacterized protein n=1 Tax=Sphagnurus paluster TaxID=117069 RepID=A0A9P7KHK6_9AGAR|nr:hypothetical protein H0H81_001677 [Sphagnurus paluster]
MSVKKWLAWTEATGWELSAYRTFLLMVISSATMLGRTVERRRYQGRDEAWTGARGWGLDCFSLGLSKIGLGDWMLKVIDMLAFAVVVSGLLAAQEDSDLASASVLNLQSRSILHSLLQERQNINPLSNAPPQTCMDYTCLCTATNAGLLQDCTDCIVSISPTDTAIAEGQSILDGTYQVQSHSPPSVHLAQCSRSYAPFLLFVCAAFASGCTGVAGIPSLSLTLPSTTASGSAVGSTPANSATAPGSSVTAPGSAVTAPGSTATMPGSTVTTQASTMSIQTSAGQSTATPAEPTGSTKSNGAAGPGIGLGQVSGQGALVVAGVLAGVVFAFA